MEENCTLGNHRIRLYGWEKTKNEIVPKHGEKDVIQKQSLEGTPLDQHSPCCDGAAGGSVMRMVVTVDDISVFKLA